MDRFFNILVRRLRLRRVHHVDVVVAADLAGVALDPVSVKDQDHRAFAEALVVAQDVHQLAPGPVDAGFGQLL